MDLPNDWVDITESLPRGTPPTLAKPEGIGVVQFTVAKYSGGNTPKITIETLDGFIDEFFESKQLQRTEVSHDIGSNLCVSAISSEPDQLTRAWYVSDGTNIALVTYVCLDVNNKQVDMELNDASFIVKSIIF